MENHIFKLQGGREVELNDIDMQRIHEYFQKQSTADYIRENYPVLTEKKYRHMQQKSGRGWINTIAVRMRLSGIS